MPPQSMTTAELAAALRQFLNTWRTETARSGFDDVGYMTAAIHEPEGWAIYCRLRAAIGSAAVQAMFAECEGLAA